MKFIFNKYIDSAIIITFIVYVYIDIIEPSIYILGRNESYEYKVISVENKNISNNDIRNYWKDRLVYRKTDRLFGEGILVQSFKFNSENRDLVKFTILKEHNVNKWNEYNDEDFIPIESKFYEYNLFISKFISSNSKEVIIPNNENKSGLKVYIDNENLRIWYIKNIM